MLVSSFCAHLVLNGAGTIVDVVAVDQHVCHLAVPQECDVVPLLGLRWVRERSVCMWQYQCLPAQGTSVQEAVPPGPLAPHHLGVTL